MLDEIVEKTNPDLILLTGDLVYGEFDNNGSSFLALVEFMESLGVPWAPIFGNHESESAMGVNWQCEQFEAAENCLFVQRDITGNGNYTVGIEQGGVMTRVFFMLDSNGCSAASNETLINNTHFKTSSGFGNDQIKWYTKLINSIKELSPKTKFSFAFHIQIKAIVDALETYATGADTAFIDRLNDKNEEDFGYIGASKSSGWDTDYAVWNGLKALGVDSIFVGHVHTHSASIVYEGVRVQFGMKSSTYDQINYVTSDGKIEAGYRLSGKTPWVGGTVMKLAEDGSITDAYIYYCENAGGNIDWDSILSCKHTESTNEWVVNASNPQYESSVCSVCGEPAIRSRTTTDEGLLIFGHELIKNKVGSNAEILNDGPGGMSYVRLHATKESGNEAVLIYGDKNNALTNLGGYVAILYRTSAKQKLLYAIDSNSSVQNGGVQKLATDSSNGMWDFVVHKNPTHDFYDGEKLTAFAFYYFAADTVRTLDDYTDIAFIGFFSTEEEAWDFFEQYRTVYEFDSGKDLANKYYVHLNGGDTKIDDNKLITGANASVNKPHVFDCSAFPITSVTGSLKLYGWCATPGGISEYGYYVVNGDNKSEYVFITNGKDSTSSDILNQFAAYNYPASAGVGILMGSTNPVKINLTGYENKTVTVIYVAKTNWGAEIELAYFTSVKVPCDHSGSQGGWVLDTANPQYEITTCSACGETASRLVSETEEGLLLFTPDFIKGQAGTSANATIMNEGGMSFVRLNPIAETGNKNILLHANNVDPYTNLGGYVAILYRTSVDQKLKLAFDSTHNYIFDGNSIRTINTVKSTSDWQLIIYEATPNTNYDGEKLSTFALFPFTVDRAMDDYTDIAFIAFFSTAEEAWEFFATYHSAYSAKGDSFATQYYFNINGNTNIDGNSATSFDIKGQYGTNSPLTTDCSDKTFNTASSIHFGGWFATPGGIKEYGYYVVDGDSVSEYKFL